MNREQRRRLAKGKDAEIVFQQAKSEGLSIGAESGFNDGFLMVAFILHEKFGFGKVRLERLMEEGTKLLSALGSKHISFEDMEDVMEEIYGRKFRPIDEITMPKGA